jgi:hypothetical protein
MEPSLIEIMELEWWERPSQIILKKELKKIIKKSAEKRIKILKKRRIV